MQLRSFAIRVITTLVLLAVWVSPFVTAQETKPSSPEGAVGTWQGTFGPDANARIVVKISSANGNLRGVFWWVDRDDSATSFSSVTFRQPGLVADSDLLGVHYTAVLAADGQTMTGTWTQQKQQSALRLTEVSAEAAWKHSEAAAPTPMAATADPAFAGCHCEAKPGSA